MRALLFQMALGAEVILGSPHRTGREGVWAGTSATRARGSCTVISVRNPSVSTAQPLLRSPSLNKGVTPSSPPVGLPRGLPAPCTRLLPGRQGAARAACEAGALGHWASFLEGNVLPRIAKSICLHTSGNSCPDVYQREAQRCLLWDFMALRLCGGDCINDGCSGARGQGLTHLPAPSPPVDRSQTVESVLCCQTASVNRTRGQPWQYLSLIRDFHRGSRSGLAATQGCLAIAQVLSPGSQGFIKGHCQRDQA